MFEADIIVTAIIAAAAGGLTVRAFMRNKIADVQGMLDYFQSSYRSLVHAYTDLGEELETEYNLNQGLTQELAAQAKLVK